jgi:hypothetical protein
MAQAAHSNSTQAPALSRRAHSSFHTEPACSALWLIRPVKAGSGVTPPGLGSKDPFLARRTT